MSTNEDPPAFADKQSYSSAEPEVEAHGIRNESEGSLTFHNVGYEASARCGRDKKVILESCSGIMRSGVNAIMGPSGGGKTTLLDILADRKSKKDVTGTILVNGKRRPSNFKLISGYVVQDDLMMGVLTVRENLQFSAALRLPSYMTHKQRRERVKRVIEELGLQSCADTRIGTHLLRGVSGGERKRTAVGMELIIEPNVLFLDEPTSGLDARTAVSVMQLLLQLACVSGSIVVLSIHQPRYSIFKLFKSLTLLSRGKVVFHGPAKKTLSYFDRIGFPCPMYENPADFFMDVLIGCECGDFGSDFVMGDKEQRGIEMTELKSNEQAPLVQEEKPSINQADGTAIGMVEHYQRSELHTKTEKQLKSILEKLQGEKRGEEEINKSVSYATNVFWQMSIVSLRALVNTMRNPQSFNYMFVHLTIIALMVGMVFFQQGNKRITESNLPNVINDRIGALFFVVMNILFTNQSAIAVFLKQKALFIHENASGYYRVSAFFIAQIFSDLVPKRIIPITLYATLVYFMIGLQPVPSKFLVFLLTLYLVSVTGAAITYATGSIFDTTEMLGGFFISLDSLPKWLQWLKYLSLCHYAIEAVTINEISGQFYYANSTELSGDPYSCHPPYCLNGTEDLIHRGFETSNIWILYDHMALLAITKISLLIFFIKLQFIKKNK